MRLKCFWGHNLRLGLFRYRIKVNAVDVLDPALNCEIPATKQAIPLQNLGKDVGRTHGLEVLVEVRVVLIQPLAEPQEPNNALRISVVSVHR